MDGSFLSRAEVVAASRKFVCVRLLTYESKPEADFLKALFVGRSGEVENTTFAILSPDGKQPLVQPARSVRHVLGTPAQLVAAMDRIAQKYPGQNVTGEPELPKVANVRLALDVAACDHRPLALLVARDADTLRRLEARLQKLAWSEPFIGRLIYAVATDPARLPAIEGMAPASGLMVIQPDRFGLTGTVLAQAAASAASEELAATLEKGLRLHRPASQANQERDGHRLHIFWETQIPVTDPLERWAREMGRRLPP